MSSTYKETLTSLQALKEHFARYCVNKHLNPVLAITDWPKIVNVPTKELSKQFAEWFEKLFCIEEKSPKYMSTYNTMFCIDLKHRAPNIFAKADNQYEAFYVWVCNEEKDY